eukprot:gb/GEZN01007867.1/.p1 GENE.gb/GEZN01007867.1/~~gb/GEZN01007867.1/.p1  ORF type:complete len:433 (-),score=39.93 gb/GEZN01007867.1/:168-1466(-)
MSVEGLLGLPSVKELRDKFNAHFGAQSGVIYTSDFLLASAPGRINLIGEHTDYSEGFVFPCGLGRRTALIFRARPDSLVRVYAADLDQSGEADLTTATLEKKELYPKFLQFLLGPCVQLRDALKPHPPPFGFDAVLASTIPIGGGVSSSSALAVTAAVALRAINPTLKAIVPAAKFFSSICEGEWQWSGVRGGIMDQYTALHCKSGRAFVLDCRTAQPFPVFSEVQLPNNLGILIANTNVRHELVGSPYNERRAACERAVKFIQEYQLQRPSEIRKPVSHLRDVDESLLMKAADHTNLDAQAYRRALHVIQENERTLECAKALQRGDLILAGALVNQSHDSLRDLFKVSCEELDIMVEIARSLEGVYGARMMGGGFGGCCVVFVDKARLNQVSERLAKEYKVKTGKEGSMLSGMAAQGAVVAPLNSFLVSKL